ncbi:cytochrome P460 family protein [Halodesulfovibrio marinisediminis]|uniref:Cytochrome P460 n=1 Tax=Halodesulfovibrio marinisediminis DSM 17456 TaxID=1121457 RepID=A0A1N6IB84_9BACT|nr:cytochrome P460 family protein [Halodesulfovibrio marinisediminis]SIO29286.1 Cytochrome P460 [Halodesulfovibrio marinisediminis DSM 17456]
MAESVQNIRRVVWLMFFAVLFACPAMAVSIPSGGISSFEEWEKAFNKWDSGRAEWKQPRMAPNKLPFPVDYRDWRVLSVSHHEDQESIRVILGNDVAIRAAREKRFTPWPEGAMLIKVLWRQRRLPTWKESWVPAEILGVGIMYKDREQFADTLGWGFSLWQSEHFELPEDFNTDVQGCVQCHSPLKDSDYVFTVPAIFP